MGGKGPEVLSTFTSDFGAILAGLHRTKIHGTAHLSSSIQVAGVCLDSMVFYCRASGDGGANHTLCYSSL